MCSDKLSGPRIAIAESRDSNRTFKSHRSARDIRIKIANRTQIAALESQSQRTVQIARIAEFEPLRFETLRFESQGQMAECGGDQIAPSTGPSGPADAPIQTYGGR